MKAYICPLFNKLDPEIIGGGYSEPEVYGFIKSNRTFTNIRHNLYRSSFFLKINDIALKENYHLNDDCNI